MTIADHRVNARARSAVWRELVQPDRHITVAWGRDYTDVVPVRRGAVRAARRPAARISVDVVRLDSAR